MRVRILLIALVCLLAGQASFAGDDTFKLYLVRHAEKQADGGRDPALTAQGQQRAVDLAAWLQDKGIADVWSSDYQRTRSTAAPLLSRPGLALKFYHPGELPQLAAALIERRKTALVVGHSNTTPELARMLCECEIADMDETEYDRLIVITVDDDQANATTLNQARLN